MMRRFVGMLLLIAGSLSNFGCMTCSHQAVDRSLAPELYQDQQQNFPCGAQRHRVHVVIINGFDPLNIAHIDGLRDKLNACGFAKVSVGEWFHVSVLEHELAKIRCEEPDTRVVVVGYSVGIGAARALCSRIVAQGGTVDSLVELAPVTVPMFTLAHLNYYAGRRVVVSPDANTPEAMSPNTTHVATPRVNHYSIPSTDASVAAVLQEVRFAAERVPQQGLTTGPTLALVDDPAPMPGMLIPTPSLTPKPVPTPVPTQPNLITQPRVIPPYTTRTLSGTLTSGTLR
jgi:hypothetical protein